mmetsp:Transcript_11912/g.20689  ORF Transcript_11912/g.20689 Transcript_11912/m.20689 type:complete len:276 (+) Transcript_11912:32-859(+)|eukprot:CAMPEP_0183704126 /NCGR_PEP_ID=MMETSP0737-20130205/1576_1 /TAXON_ID=385413 /ORGANISM="Thalassiosira miniscula, Strain CCMP1093" /LENGTH=275 /DNA_ID=CAMNT_0025930947 /DNA_START=28 /DNA_END=855 /DNA_ORIENTATION=+
MTTKVCVLTGASGTIGYAIAQALKASSTPSQAWHIIIIGRREPPPSITHVDGKPPATLPYDTFLQATLTDEPAVTSTLNSHFESLQSTPDKSVQSLNRLDLLINCAGCSLGNEPIANVSADTLRQVMEINLIAPFILSKWAMSKMANPSGGRIINIGSIARQAPRLHSVPYFTSKCALAALNRSLSLEGRHLAQTTQTTNEDVGNGVVAVCLIDPGNVRSGLMSAEEAERRAKEEGFVDPEDLGKFVATVANLPNEANVLESTVMPTRQPLVGRG